MPFGRGSGRSLRLPCLFHRSMDPVARNAITDDCRQTELLIRHGAAEQTTRDTSTDSETDGPNYWLATSARTTNGQTKHSSNGGASYQSTLNHRRFPYRRNDGLKCSLQVLTRLTFASVSVLQIDHRRVIALYMTGSVIKWRLDISRVILHDVRVVM